MKASSVSEKQEGSTEQKQGMLKFDVRCLTGTKYRVVVSPDQAVIDLKKAVLADEEFRDYVKGASMFYLIHLGKQLRMDQSLKDLKLKVDDVNLIHCVVRLGGDPESPPDPNIEGTGDAP
mmetsp:Transcript_23120/g.37139  ORF Transcript_23120/g.37139 Transcript_23120/m.37139 type:complete len:120 (-) Transcript_23120:272-631(-)